MLCIASDPEEHSQEDEGSFALEGEFFEFLAQLYKACFSEEHAGNKANIEQGITDISK